MKIEDKELNNKMLNDYTNLIISEFESLKHTLISNNRLKKFDSDYEINQEEFEKEEEENIKLYDYINYMKTTFISDNNKTIYNDFNACSYNTKNNIVFNADNINYVKSTLIHEFSHQMIYFFSDKKINGHCLEFAIFNYCLFNTFSRKSIYDIKDNAEKKCKFYKHTFFRSYDIHEDIAYPFLSINVCKFDSLILTIKFNSLQDLYNKSVYYADKIRQKAIAL